MSSEEIDEVKRKIGETETDIKETKAKLKKAEEDNKPTETIMAYLTSLQITLASLNNEKIELLKAANASNKGKSSWIESLIPSKLMESCWIR
jgi:hypothetical protein